MAKMLRFDDHARLALKRGIDQVADAVKVTLGPRGRGVILHRAGGSPVVTNDGVTIARDIELPDPYENIGAQLLREVATKTQEVAGDGTTTATLLAQSIVTQGLIAVNAGVNPLHLRRGIERAVQVVVEQIAAQARPVTDRTAMERVATLAANQDRELGRLIAEALETVGAEGIATVEPGRRSDNTLRVTRGFAFGRGYISPYFVTEPETMIGVLESPYVLIHEERVGDLEPLVPLLTSVAERSAGLLVVAEDVEGETLATLVMNRLRGTLDVIAVKAPEFGDRRREVLEDLAIATGTVVVAESQGRSLSSVSLCDLGRARRVEVSRDFTTIFEGAGSAEQVEERCRQVRRQIDESGSEYDCEKLRERLARLRGRVAVVEVGGFTETEQREKQSRAEDALAATRAAAEEGVVPGGGVAFLRALPALANLEPASEGERAGIEIVRRAILAPMRLLAENAGFDGASVVEECRKMEASFGFNVETGQYEDLFESGVLDAAKVARSSLQAAASIGALILTTETIVAERDDPPDAPGASE